MKNTSCFEQAVAMGSLFIAGIVFVDFGFFAAIIVGFIGVQLTSFIHNLSDSTETTNYSAAIDLGAEFPRSFRKAQDILVFMSKRQLRNTYKEKLIKELIELSVLLNLEDFANEKRYREDFQWSGQFVIEFFSQFSKCFPNWQAEYQEIEELTREGFGIQEEKEPENQPFGRPKEVNKSNRLLNQAETEETAMLQAKKMFDEMVDSHVRRICENLAHPDKKSRQANAEKLQADLLLAIKLDENEISRRQTAATINQLTSELRAPNSDYELKDVHNAAFYYCLMSFQDAAKHAGLKD